MKYTITSIAVAILGAAVEGRVMLQEGEEKRKKVKITEADMDSLVNAFCDACVAISDAFWDNGGRHHDEGDAAYPQAACDAAYGEAAAALSGAYNYPGPVLFKPTLSTAPYTFRPTKQGALSYFIGTDCLLKSGTEDFQFPPGNTAGSDFHDYGFALANYGPGMEGFSGCEWVPDSYVSGNRVGVAQGQVNFLRTEGTVTTVDKTFSFGSKPKLDNKIVITGHHSSLIIEPETSDAFHCSGGFPVCRTDESEYCDGARDCSIDFCECDAGRAFCETGVNPCDEGVSKEMS